MSSDEKEEMVEVGTMRYRNGISFTVRAPQEDVTWVRALFTRNAEPFKALRDAGFVAVSHKQEEKAHADDRSR